MDQYSGVRSIPLLGVLRSLGHAEMKKRGKLEWTMKCPVTQVLANAFLLGLSDNLSHMDIG
jgi:hypothetical protein